MRGVPVYPGSPGAFVAPAQHRLYFLPEPHGQGPLREGAGAVECARTVVAVGMRWTAARTSL